jgi:LysM repeat protein
VQEGEVLLSIAELYDTTVDEILALNPSITPELLQEGQVLLIPPAIPTPGPTDTPPDTVDEGYLIHVVEPGETLISVASQYSVSVSMLRAVNPSIPASSDIIRPNQSLVIPLGTPAPTSVATVDPLATPTPISEYPAPLLLHPPDGAVFGGPDAEIVLHWVSVGILNANEWYEVRVARPGADPVVYRTWGTAYRVPEDLFPPPEARTREFRWQVRIVRQEQGSEAYEQASETGPIFEFTWLEEVPTPIPTITPTLSPTP